MKLAVVIPAWNEEGTIGAVIKSIPHLNKRVSKTEVIVVDDGSSDRTAAIAKGLGATVVSHNGNKGVGKAFQTGVEACIERFKYHL